MRSYILPAGFVLLWVTWLVWILVYGGVSWPTNQESAGQFGDAFGAIASLMATIAAIGVYFTFIQDRAARAEQAFEDNFFRLLSNFESIASTISITYSQPDAEISTPQFKYPKLIRVSNRTVIEKINDQDAIRLFIYLIRNRLEPISYNDSKIIHRAYNAVYSEHVDRIGHYFRTLYHIFRLIDEHCHGDKQRYARIARAHLRDSELRLVAYNLAVGEGRFKFKKLAREYALLHNMNRVGLDKFEEKEIEFFIRHVGYKAFRFEDEPAFTYE